jgi:hypothetical protein
MGLRCTAPDIRVRVCIPAQYVQVLGYGGVFSTLPLGCRIAEVDVVREVPKEYVPDARGGVVNCSTWQLKHTFRVSDKTIYELRQRGDVIRLHDIFDMKKDLTQALPPDPEFDICDRSYLYVTEATAWLGPTLLWNSIDNMTNCVLVKQDYDHAVHKKVQDEKMHCWGDASLMMNYPVNMNDEVVHKYSFRRTAVDFWKWMYGFGPDFHHTFFGVLQRNLTNESHPLEAFGDVVQQMLAGEIMNASAYPPCGATFYARFLGFEFMEDLEKCVYTRDIAYILPSREMYSAR